MSSDSLDLHRAQDLRSLELHVEAVKVLREHPEKVSRVLQVLDNWDQLGDSHSKPLRDEWRRIIEGRHWDEALAENDRGQQLRQASPLGFLVDPAVRAEILMRYRRKG
ncbi:hypothetical protein [Ramlibacter alkalitolerans]|uniref:Uncharacterized protein n=1 Tax=Ramlibacter alkalitolerans TaxID=2039631 RepID=A0ABS1JUC4_9BURK|nr:hypothetical protein [Ramlibacter alkalitolerans]MBL0427829.1 hypothetical protein [Ramlibacter alkalitolerans]